MNLLDNRLRGRLTDPVSRTFREFAAACELWRNATVGKTTNGDALTPGPQELDVARLHVALARQMDELGWPW